MLLKSSLLILLIVNIAMSNLWILTLTTLILIGLNIYYKIDLKKNIKKIKFLFIIYFITCMLQIFYTQEGQVILKIYNFYITVEGITNFMLNFLRIFNLLLISWIVVEKKILSGRFNRYENVIMTTIELVPTAFVMIKKRMKIKWFFRYIMKQIKIKN